MENEERARVAASGDGAKGEGRAKGGGGCQDGGRGILVGGEFLNQG